MTLPLFTELGLASELVAGIQHLGFECPSPIQSRTIPVALSGRDVVGLSETGSGKTAAFVLPSLQCIDCQNKKPQVLIHCPTRELSVQVCQDDHHLGMGLKGLHAIPVYGGAPIDRQVRLMSQGVHVIVGTPGRLLDHLQRGSLDTAHIRITVLDEADRMLDMGFRDDMETLLGALPETRQTLFFSATMNDKVKRLIQHFGRDPEHIHVERKALAVASVEQTYYEVRNRSKVEVLSRLMDTEPQRLAMVFCNTKRMVDECCEALLARGYAVDRLHGDITQKNRERTLKKFRDGTVELFVATDVAARGLDIDEVDVVFNYDLPQDPEDYVHRIGRTGRAGRSGRAVSFVYGRDVYRLQTIERYTRQAIRRVKVPTQEDVQGRRADTIFNTLRERLELQKFERYDSFIDRLLDQGHTPTDIAGALFTLLREASTKGRELTPIKEDDLSEVSDSQSNRLHHHYKRSPKRPKPFRRGLDGFKQKRRSRGPFKANRRS